MPHSIRPPIRQAMLDTARKPGRVARETGNVDTEFAKGGKTLEASYYTPMLAHAAMEPLAAVAEFKDGKVVTWTCTQNPQAVQETVATRGGHQERRRGVPCDAAGRRIRAQVEAGLRG
jgi:isoquinoline 1-oxidoreductase beta subunit